MVFNFDVGFMNPLPTGSPEISPTLIIHDLRAELKIRAADGKDLYAGQLTLKAPFSFLQINQNWSVSLVREFNPYLLSSIEKLRPAKEIQFFIILYFASEFEGKVQSRSPVQVGQAAYRISKSDWVEAYLPQLGYKTVSLIEVPQLLDGDFSEAIANVNDAWKQYSMGDYRKVFADCRNAIDCLSEKIKSKGFVKQEPTENGKSKPVPNWNEFLDDEELGDVLAALNKKLFRLASIGAHGSTGRIIGREDAEFALMTTHAMVNLVVQKFKQ
jgi:hypothetical protein